MKHLSLTLATLALVACAADAGPQTDTTEGVDCAAAYEAGLGRWPVAFPRVVDVSRLAGAEFVLTGAPMVDAFEAAAASWNASFDFDVFALDYEGDGDVRAYADETLSAGGWAGGNGARATIKMHPGVHNPLPNVKHELGHVLGLPHESDPTSVMYGGDSEGHGSLADNFDHVSAMARCLIKTTRINQ